MFFINDFSLFIHFYFTEKYMGKKIKAFKNTKNLPDLLALRLSINDEN